VNPRKMVSYTQRRSTRQRGGDKDSIAEVRRPHVKCKRGGAANREYGAGRGNRIHQSYVEYKLSTFRSYPVNQGAKLIRCQAFP
jgi:hypothetical protein